MKVYINELKEGLQIEEKFAVKYKKAPIKYRNGYMFILGLSDKTGEIELHYWGNNNEEEVLKIYSSINEEDVILVKGRVSIYNEKMKIDVNKEEGKIEKTEDYEKTDFIGISPRDFEEMKALFYEFLNELDKPYKDLVNEILNRYPEFFQWPASLYKHHAYIHGLLEHTVNMLTVAKAYAPLYGLDKQLLYTGIMLHDIGKVKEIEVGNVSLRITREGMLLSHIVLGEVMVTEIGKAINIDENILNKIRHIIISHHGKKEYGAIKEPEFPEAWAVHLIDMLDSQPIQMKKLIDETNSEDFRLYSKSLKKEIYLD